MMAGKLQTAGTYRGPSRYRKDGGGDDDDYDDGIGRGIR